MDPGYIPDPFHVFLAGELEKIEKGDSNRTIINVPPQHGKTRLTAIEFASWYLGKHPKERIVVASFGQSLSNEASRDVRQRLQDPEYQKIFSTRLRPGDGKIESWGTTEKGGLQAVGIGGGLSGRRANVLIIDDPLKDYVEAHSKAAREKVWNWYLSVARLRLQKGGKIIVIMTRWHTDDLVGRLTDPDRLKEIEEKGAQGEDWNIINLEALAPEEGDPLGRSPGEALATNRFDRQDLINQKAIVSDYIWAALFCGKPVAKGGNEIPVDSFKYISREEVPEGLRHVRFWDLAAEDKKRNDSTAGVRAALGPPPGGSSKDEKVLYLIDIEFGKWKWPKSRERIASIAKSEKIKIGVEAVAGFKVAYQNLIEVLAGSGVVAKEYGADKDKLTRALPWIELVHRGMVYIVRGDWNVEFLREAEVFPDGAHDDLIDGVSGAHIMLKSAKKIIVA